MGKALSFMFKTMTETPRLFQYSYYTEDMGYKDGFGKILRRAHDLILKDNMNPYKAWLIALGKNWNDAPKLLGLDRAKCFELLKKSGISPPAVNILQFCVETGIHPAHLQPGLTQENHPYHFNVLDAMTEILRDKKKHEIEKILAGRAVSELDSHLCFEAFKAEKARYQKLEKDSFIKGVSSILAVNTGLEFLRNSPHENFRVVETGREFNYLSGYHHSDIDLALETVYSKLIDAWHQIEEAMTFKIEKALNSLDALKSDAVSLFGPIWAGEVTDRIIDAILQAEDLGLVTKEAREDMILMLVKKNTREDFNEYCMAHKLFPWEVIDDFSRKIEAHFEDLSACEIMSENLEKAEEKIDNFNEWKFDPSLERRHLQVIRNYKLIEGFCYKFNPAQMIATESPKYIDHGHH